MKPLLLFVGDSWGDYPGVGGDVGTQFESVGYDVDSIAQHGQTLDHMAYDQGHGVKLGRLFTREQQRGRTPLAVVVSAGGNDIAGADLFGLLNHARSGLPALNESAVDGAFERLATAYRHLLFGLRGLSARLFGHAIPTIVHGYGYPTPDGRGFLGGSGILPGPWLRPYFERRGHFDQMANAATMERLVDRMYGTLASVVATAGLEHVRLVDIRPRLRTSGSYRDLWADELHPTELGFARVAAAMLETIGTP